MNAKAERIEQIIQIVSRNLALILSHETDSLTPLDARELQKVDMGVFNHDKFAFEMSHFVKSESVHTGHKMTEMWEWNFLKGLETLLVEAAVVPDEIERDCFISRIYCWYNEKLLERKDLPRGPITKKGLMELSNTLESMGGKHSSKAMMALADKKSDDYQEEFHDGEDPENDDRKIKKFAEPERPVSASQAPLYVKHSYPDVMKPGSASDIIRSGIGPAGNVPDSSNNYGMLYHKPDSQSEIQMHDLWVAKRRQEAFDWKTQQHLAVVMDRLAVHKSRMETDALRRQESGNFMVESRSRPGSGSSTTGAKFVMQLRRPMSGRQRQFASLTPFDATVDRVSTAGDDTIGRTDGGPGPPSVVNEERSLEQFSLDDFAPDFIGKIGDEEEKGVISSGAEGDEGSFEGVTLDSSLGDDASIIIRGEDDEEVKVPSMKRSVTKKVKDKDKRYVVPMRYGDSKVSQPTISRLKMEQHKYLDYMYEDEDNDSFKLPSIKGAEKLDTASGSMGENAQAQPSPAKKKKSAKGGAGAGNKGPVRKFVEIREKAHSTKKLKEVSYNDLELKIYDRHVNVRCMPLTEEAEKWLNDRENERAKAYSEKVKKLKEDFAAKNAKSKDKGGDKKDAKKDKKKVVEEPPPIISKYKSASQFMSIHFPVFDSYSQAENMGPMRAQQMNECQRVIEVFEQAGIEIDPERVYKGLLIPQDRPESICLENLREGLEGLMTNPLPKEFWRKELAPAKGGKKGKKGKKKK